ncbi:hypothetical protein ACFL14_00860 [Patescibacteria group bacterium]
MKEEIINKIKSHGYWRVNLRPIVFSKKLSLAESEKIIEKNSVEFRGWDYPHIPRRHGDDTGSLRSSDYVEAWVDWSYFKEYWRMYRSTQFLHYIGFRVDWMNERDSSFGIHDKAPMADTELGVIDITYQLTEIFEFISRLIQDGLYENGVEVKISLHNLVGRKLVIDNPKRVGFMVEKITGANEHSYSKVFSKDEILSDSKKPALQMILQIFELFKWDDPPIDTIKKDQEDLLLKKFY